MQSQRGVDCRQTAFFAGAAERLARLRGEMEDDAEAFVDASSAFAVPALLEAAPRAEIDESRDSVAAEEGVEAGDDGLAPTAVAAVEVLVADAVQDEAAQEPAVATARSSERPGGVLAAALAAMRAAELARGAGTRVEWAPVQQLPSVPRHEAVMKQLSRKTLKLLRWIKKLWEGWVARKAVGVDTRSGPTWDQVRGFGFNRGPYRQPRPVPSAEAGRKGEGRRGGVRACRREGLSYTRPAPGRSAASLTHSGRGWARRC